ncbi:recombination protein RecR [Candidatus Peregrinibacteria bacterium]|nr:recombination protein RecR [Candidatus Peregrinibacteria bacterium]
MKAIPENIAKAIEEFQKLPGIGQKTAERLVFHLLRKPEADLGQFGKAVSSLKEGIRYCDVCKNLTTEKVCGVCADSSRDPSVICVVEDPLDLIALEKANEYQGVYHVLHGVISPMEGVGPDELAIAELIDRLEKGGVKEVIIALNPSMEGEATAAYLMKYIKPLNIKVTRIARGIPVGGDLEYADSQTLKRALLGRMEY